MEVQVNLWERDACGDLWLLVVALETGLKRISNEELARVEHGSVIGDWASANGGGRFLEATLIVGGGMCVPVTG